MAISRTSKGFIASKLSGNTLTISNVSTTKNLQLVVGISWEDDNPGESPVLDHGGQLLYELPGVRVTQGTRILTVYSARSRNAKAGTSLIATWPTNLTARAMVACEVQEASLIDIFTSNTETAVTTADTGSAGTSSVADTISLGFFSVIGPGSDNPQPTGGSGHTLHQEASTNGGTATDNITLYDTSEILSATGTVQASITSMANARDVASIVIAFQAGETYTVSRARYIPFDGYPGHEAVEFIMEDSGSTELFTVRIPREEFENLNDTEVEDKIREECIWWANKQDGAASPAFEPDSTFNSRVSSFVNDSFPT